MSFYVTNKERKLRRCALLFSLAFLFVCYQCTGQTSSYPMKFSCGRIDTIYIYVNTDSLNHSQLFVQCSKHTHKTWTGITIGFVDGDMLQVYSKDCYAINDIDKLKYAKFDYISFDEILSSTACVNIKTKDYFIKFFNDNKLK